MRGKGEEMKRLGVIGGLGPMATVYFLQLVTQMTDAKVDKEHIEILMKSVPSTPDRTAYILKQMAMQEEQGLVPGKDVRKDSVESILSDNPMPIMTKTGAELETMGAQILAIPCITAHYFHEEMQEQLGIPLLHGIEETVAYLKQRGIEKVGIMATDGTVRTGLFQKELEKQHMQAFVPDTEGQKGVMTLIYDQVKAGCPIDLALFQKIAGGLFAQGAEVVLLGCTELSLIKRDFEIGSGFLDVMEVLARKAVLECGRLKADYRELVTKA